ncbi:hypothetical protein [Mycobacterium sp. C31M]
MNHCYRLVTAITACSLTVAPISGCATTVSAGTPAAPVAEQIRYALEQVVEGYLTFDVDRVAAFTCTKYRDIAIADIPAEGINEVPVPPMEVMPVDALARLERQELGAEYVGATRRSLLDLADAFIARAPAAYEDGRWKDCTPPVPSTGST